MNENTIRELLGRYMDGETTLAEEKALGEYFAAADEVPADIAYAREMFRYFGAAAGAKPERAFDIPAQEAMPPVRKPRSSRRAHRIWAWAGSAAAAAAAIVAVAMLVSQNGKPEGEVVYCYINGEPVTDYDLAYAYTQGALGLIEDNMKKPGEYLMPIEYIGNSLESLRCLELLGLFTDDE